MPQIIGLFLQWRQFLHSVDLTLIGHSGNSSKVLDNFDNLEVVSLSKILMLLIIAVSLLQQWKEYTFEMISPQSPVILSNTTLY